MRRCLPLLALLTLLCGVRAQATPGLDSLRQAYARATHDTVRVKLALAMAGELLLDSPDSAYALCLRTLPVALRTGRPQEEGEVEGWLGYLAEQQGRIPAAIEHYQHSLAATVRAKDAKAMATVLNNLAAIYKDQGRMEESLELNERSLRLKEVIGDSLGMATSYNNLGLIRFDQGRLAEALDQYDQALRIYEAIGDQEGVSTVLHNIAGVYGELGQDEEALRYLQRALTICQLRKDRYTTAYTLDNIGTVLSRLGRRREALERFEQARAMREAIHDERGLGYSHRNIGSEQLATGDVADALQHFTLALDLFTRSEDKRGRATTLLTRSQALERLGRSAEAMAEADSALTLGVELGNVNVQRDAAGILTRAHRQAGRWQQALAMRELYDALSDSVQNTDNRRRSMRQEFQYAYTLKEAGLHAEQQRRDLEARERLQKEKNRRNVLLFSGVGVLLVAMGLAGRLRFMRRSRAALQKEKDRSDELLLNILPGEVADELKAKGHAEAKHFDRATILFTDFKGFTSLSETLSPAELVDELNTCFKAFDHIITTRGIEKIKTIGDAYMCVGGLPDPASSAPSDVVHAALAMQAFMAQHKAEREAMGKPCFEMRVGIHSGPVVAGIVGVKKFQYDIWGDTVNTASRMESSGEVGQVNISEATHALVKDASTPLGTPAFTFIPRGKVQAKGKGEMEMYFVRSSSERA